MADKVEADTENTITSANGCDDNSTEHHSNDAR